MKYLIFRVSKIGITDYFIVTNQSCHIQKTIYKKSAVQSASLSFWIFSLFQYFEQKIIDISSDIVELYK